MNKLISFIIPAYNCADTIEETVNSIINGNYESGDEIIIINDFSTDNTKYVIDNLINNNQDIKIIYLEHKFNKGTAAAGRNTGITHAKNDILFCLDADNILVSESILKLKQYMLDQNADIASFREMHYFKDNINNVTHKWIFKKGVITFADALAGPYWPGPSGNYMFTRESWLKAGRYFEPVLLNQTLDSWTFGIRQLATGSKMVTLDNNWYLHRYGIESHYIREAKKNNRSIAGAVGLAPFFNQIHPRDLNYILGSRHRYDWIERLDKRPIRVADYKIGVTGVVKNIK